MGNQLYRTEVSASLPATSEGLVMENVLSSSRGACVLGWLKKKNKALYACRTFHETSNGETSSKDTGVMATSTPLPPTGCVTEPAGHPPQQNAHPAAVPQPGRPQVKGRPCRWRASSGAGTVPQRGRGMHSAGTVTQEGNAG